MALDRKKIKKDLEALDEEDRGLVSDVLKELSGDGDAPTFTAEEVTGLKDLLGKVKKKKGGVLGFLSGE